MKKIVYLLPALMVLALMAACNKEIQVATAEVEDSVRAEGLDAGVEASCSMQYLTGGVSQEDMDRINASIVGNHILFDEANGSTDVPAAVRTWVDEILSSFSLDAEEITEDNAWMYNWSFDRSGEFTTACKTRKLQTYMGSYNEYTGGAHGEFGVGYDVFDMTTGEILTEADLFIDDFFSPLCDMLEDSVMENVPEEDREMMFGMPEPNGNFAVSEEGITWWYNAYEIAPYVLGTLSATLSWEELAPFLK